MREMLIFKKVSLAIAHAGADKKMRWLRNLLAKNGCWLHKFGQCCLAHPSEEELTASHAFFYDLTNKCKLCRDQQVKVAVIWGMANTEFTHGFKDDCADWRGSAAPVQSLILCLVVDRSYVSFGLKSLEGVWRGKQGLCNYRYNIRIFVYSWLLYVCIYVLSRNFLRATWLLQFCKSGVLQRE